MPNALSRAQVIDRIKQTALLRGDFTLRSGRKSTYYIDKYRFETQPDVLAALGEMFAAFVTPDIDRLAGAELGGIPLVTAAALASGRPSILVRNSKKEYGTNRQLEGVYEKGETVLLVEDVLTTGGQVIEAAQTLADAGLTVAKIVAVLDRQEDARANIEAAGYEMASLFTLDDLGVTKE